MDPKITASLVNVMRSMFRKGPLGLKMRAAVRPDPAGEAMVAALAPEERAAIEAIMSKFPPNSEDVLGTRMVFQDKHAARYVRDNPGCQVVLMGAGMDMVSSRFEQELERGDFRLFEVDLPATQDHKMGLTARSEHTTYVGVDFTAGVDPFQMLRLSGLDPEVPTIWVWMGVAMYLDEQTVHGLLDSFSKNMKGADVLLMDYPKPPSLEDAQTQAALKALRDAGEPVKFAPSDFRGLAQRHHFSVVDDVSWGAAAAIFSGESSPNPPRNELSFAALQLA
jgi:methyltransferase (TIGR00027 family)